MSYALRKTPRSSFMMKRPGMGDVTATVTSPGIMSPPFAPPGTAIIPSGVMPLTPAPPADGSSNLSRYILWGGLAYLAYWLWSKE